MPRTPEQYEEIRNEKKQIIMNAALELFAEEGFHATSISKIAKKANISKGLLYNYFKSKEELLLAIIDSGFTIVISSFDPNKDTILTDEEFAFFIEQFFRLMDENISFWKLFFTLMLKPSILEIIEPQIRKWYELLYGTLIENFKRKGIEDPETEAIMFGSMIDGIGFNYVINPSMFPVEKVKQNLIKRYTNCKS